MKIVELDPKTKGVSEWPWLVLGMSQPHGDVPLERSVWDISGYKGSHTVGSGTSWGMKDISPRVGLGHLGGRGTSYYGAGISQGRRDILLWLWNILRDKGHPGADVGQGWVTSGWWWWAAYEGVGATHLHPGLLAPQMVYRKRR